MKLKNYFTILIVLFILLFYNLFCYSFANKRLKDGTDYLIKNYLKKQCDECTYQYIKSTANSDGSINVFIKTNEEKDSYYRFVLTNDNGYKIISVNKDVPTYIKK